MLEGSPVRVVELGLGYYELSGEIPSEMGDLSDLNSLHLSAKPVEWRESV